MPDRRRLPDEAKIRIRLRLRREVDEVWRGATGYTGLTRNARGSYVAVTTPSQHLTTG